MKIYKHWAKATAEARTEAGLLKLECLGGSETSAEDAAAKAREKAAHAAERMTSGETLGEYPYPDRPLREEFLGEITRDGRLVGAVTRNSRGSLVLNAANVMFVDIDRPREPAFAWLKRLFGGRVEGVEEKVVARVRNVVDTTPMLGLRLYRTAGGYRCLITSGIYDPKSPESRALLERFGSDPLYIRLCEVQESYRARLTPKFWRCDAAAPPTRFPWVDADHEAKYRQWEQSYARHVVGYATCALMGSFGVTAVVPEAQQILEVHDKFACTGADELA